MIKIITDSGADILKEEAKKLNIEVVELTINTEEKSFVPKDENELKEYYKSLATMKTLPYTSQPSPEEFLNVFDSIDEKDEVLYLGLSSKVSGTFNSANIAKEMSKNKNRIHLIDTLSGIEGLKILVWEAVRLRDNGHTIYEIINVINDLTPRIKIYGVVDTLKYLRKGGRIPKSLGIIGEILNIKPVVSLIDGVLESISKARGSKAALKSMLEEVKKDKVDSFFGIHLGYTGNIEVLEPLIEQINVQFKDIPYYISHIGGIIGTHTGPHCVTMCYISKGSVNK